MPKKLRAFDREAHHKGSWLLAGSLACPVPGCGARLRGNGEVVWCEAWHCSFWCYWEELDELAYKFNKAHTSTYLKPNKMCLQECHVCPLGVRGGI